jgi:hypothetical protein
MASTDIYKDAPLPVFNSMHTNPTSTTPWTAPFSPVEELHKLHVMAEGMGTKDWEITPIQAWFKLVERLGVEKLFRRVGRPEAESSVGGGAGKVRVLDLVERELGKLVDCLGFGAVMNEGLFWEVVSAWE